MKGMVLYKEEDKMKECIERIVNEFRIDGFNEDDICYQCNVKSLNLELEEL